MVTQMADGFPGAGHVADVEQFVDLLTTWQPLRFGHLRHGFLLQGLEQTVELHVGLFLPIQLQQAFDAVGPLRALLLRHALSIMAQITFLAACNRHHPIEQQFCRWLLCALDRLPSSDLVMTHELVANTLGVRRESITEVAGRLQQAGVIRYRRGHISVLDRAGLEHRACECYAVVKGEQRRLLASGR